MWRGYNPSFYRKPLHSRFGEATNTHGKKSATDTTLAHSQPPPLALRGEGEERGTGSSPSPLSSQVGLPVRGAAAPNHNLEDE